MKMSSKLNQKLRPRDIKFNLKNFNFPFSTNSLVKMLSDSLL